MFRVGILLQSGETLAETFDTKEQADEYLLVQMDKLQIKRAYVRNTETNEQEIVRF